MLSENWMKRMTCGTCGHDGDSGGSKDFFFSKVLCLRRLNDAVAIVPCLEA